MKKLGLLFVFVISLVFTVSCVYKEVQVIETYYETEYKTEYKTETYTETEDVVVRTSEGKTCLTPVDKWQQGEYFVAEGGGTGVMYYYDYKIDSNKHTRSQVKIVLSPIADGYLGVWNNTNLAGYDIWNQLTYPERILIFEPMQAGTDGEISFDAKGIGEFTILANTWNGYAISSVQLVWSDDIIEKRAVNKERQIPYQVPYQVEKQRTLMASKKVPFWEAFFH